MIFFNMIKDEVSLVQAKHTVDVIALLHIKVGMKFPSSIPSYCNLDLELKTYQEGTKFFVHD